jgi:dihydrofolate synthase/folylpolyglutamate synthase
LLGDTLAEIAAEKGGIIKPGVPVVVAPQLPDALACLEHIAAERGSPITLIGREWQCGTPSDGERARASRYPISTRLVVGRTAAPEFVPAGTSFDLALTGPHQLENACVAVATLAQVRAPFPELTPAAIREGLATVNWPGRLQLLGRDEGRPLLLVDCAHNVDSAHKLADAIRLDYRYDRLWLILGVTADKDQAGILRALLPLADAVFLTASSHPRAAPAADLFILAHELGYEAQVSETPAAAVLAAWRAAGPNDLICVTGSIFVVGDLLNQWERLQSQLPVASSPLQSEIDSPGAAAV